MRNLGYVAVVLGLCLAACGDSKMTVHGKVVPPPGAAVQAVIGGRSATVDPSTGAFSIGDVSAPYDLTVATTAAPRVALVYLGLKRADPVVSAPTLTGQRSANVTGHTSGGTCAASCMSSVAFGSPEIATSTPVAGANVAYSLGVPWYGPSATVGTLHALEWSVGVGSGTPSGYTGYASAAISLSDGVAASQDLALQPVASHGTASGTRTALIGASSNQIRGEVVFSDGAAIELFSDPVAPSPFLYDIPQISGATVRLSAIASLSEGDATVTRSGLAPGATGVELAFRPALVRTTPSNGATGVTGATTFGWSPMSGYVFAANFNGPMGDPTIIVHTTGNRIVIPDLSSLGITLPASTQFYWSVSAYAPLDSVDALANAAVTTVRGIEPPGDTTYLWVPGQEPQAYWPFTTAP